MMQTSTVVYTFEHLPLPGFREAVSHRNLGLGLSYRFEAYSNWSQGSMCHTVRCRDGAIDEDIFVGMFCMFLSALLNLWISTRHGKP